MSRQDLDHLLKEIRACTACTDLPLGPQPLVQASSTARVLIASQAPGRITHEQAIPFADASGDRLRAWLGLDETAFYDASRIAIVPMAFCYPGRIPGAGDAPPRPECARLWRQRLLDQLPDLRLTLLVGSFAQNYALGSGAMTNRVRNLNLAGRHPTVCLPHPSWRAQGWEKRNPWFASEVLPRVRHAVRAALSDSPAECA